MCTRWNENWYSVNGYKCRKLHCILSRDIRLKEWVPISLDNLCRPLEPTGDIWTINIHLYLYSFNLKSLLFHFIYFLFFMRESQVKWLARTVLLPIHLPHNPKRSKKNHDFLTIKIMLMWCKKWWYAHKLLLYNTKSDRLRCWYPKSDRLRCKNLKSDCLRSWYPKGDRLRCWNPKNDCLRCWNLKSDRSSYFRSSRRKMWHEAVLQRPKVVVIWQVMVVHWPAYILYSILGSALDIVSLETKGSNCECKWLVVKPLCLATDDVY